MAYPRVLIVEEPAAPLPFCRGIIDTLEAGVIVTCSAAAHLSQVLQEAYAAIVVNLPGAAGLAAIGDIRRQPCTGRTPIILVGAQADAPALQGIAGPLDYLATPVVPEVVLTKVRLFVELHVAHANLAAARQREQRLRREISHDLRTPLNAILGWTTLLRTGQLDASTAERALETVERNARAQKVLIEGLLGGSVEDPGAAQPELSRFDPRPVVEAALAATTPAAAARDVTLTADFAAGVAPVRADIAGLQQMVCGLLETAVRSTPGGGQVRLRLQCGGTDLRITADSPRGDGSATFTVRAN